MFFKKLRGFFALLFLEKNTLFLPQVQSSLRTKYLDTYKQRKVLQSDVILCDKHAALCFRLLLLLNVCSKFGSNVMNWVDTFKVQADTSAKMVIKRTDSASRCFRFIFLYKPNLFKVFRYFQLNLPAWNESPDHLNPSRRFSHIAFVYGLSPISRAGLSELVNYWLAVSGFHTGAFYIRLPMCW